MYWGTLQLFSNQLGGTLAQTPKQQPNAMCPFICGATTRECGHIFSIVPHAMCICVLIVSHIFTLSRKSVTYNVSSSTPSWMYRLFRVGMTMRWCYCDGIVAIHHINNVMGLTKTSFMNETIHHCDQTKPNQMKTCHLV